MRESSVAVTWSWVVGAMIGLAIVAGGYPTEAASCGDTIGAGEVVTLQADITCTGESASLRIVGPVTLDLNGHTISCSGGGDGSVGSPLTIGIIVDSGRAEIRNGAIVNCHAGIRLANSAPSGGSHLQDLTFRGNVFGISVQSDMHTITRNAFYNNGTGILVTDESRSNVLSDNTAVGNNRGFFLDEGTNHNRIIGNTATENQEGFRVNDSPDNTLIANVAARNTRWGFVVGGQRNSVLGNSAIANGAQGFWIQGGANVISGNIAKRNAGDGLLLSADSSVVEGNVVTKNGGDGIVIPNNIHNNTIVSNIVRRHTAPHFDLVDKRPAAGCSTTFWSRNDFITKSKACIQ